MDMSFFACMYASECPAHEAHRMEIDPQRTWRFRQMCATHNVGIVVGPGSSEIAAHAHSL